MVVSRFRWLLQMMLATPIPTFPHQRGKEIYHVAIIRRLRFRTCPGAYAPLPGQTQVGCRLTPKPDPAGVNPAARWAQSPMGASGSGFLPPPGIRRSRMPFTNCDDWAVP